MPLAITLIGGNMREFYRSMTSVLKRRMLPLGIPLYTLLFSSLYLIFCPRSLAVENVLHAAIAVS